MRWDFKIENVSGAGNWGPNALSRYPSGGFNDSKVHSVMGYGAEDSWWSEELEVGVVAGVGAHQGVRWLPGRP